MKTDEVSAHPTECLRPLARVRCLEDLLDVRVGLRQVVADSAQQG